MWIRIECTAGHPKLEDTCPNEHSFSQNSARAALADAVRQSKTTSLAEDRQNFLSHKTMGAAASSKYEVGDGDTAISNVVTKVDESGPGQAASQGTPTTSVEGLVNSALHNIVARTAAKSPSTHNDSGWSAPRTSIKDTRKSWKSATDIEGLGRPPAGPTNPLVEKTLPRINSIQSIALGHKLKRLGSYTRMVGVNGEDVAPDSHVKLAGAFARQSSSSVRVLDPLQKMKRISSTPIMREAKSHAAPKMTASNSGNEGSTISPTPLSQIHEVENENYAPSPAKGGVGGRPTGPVDLTLGDGNKFGLTVLVADDAEEEKEKEVRRSED